MIVHMNVCDQCGNQNEIHSGSMESGIDVNFKIVPTYQVIENRGNYLGSSLARHCTFCDKECMIEWFKSNVSSAGVVKTDTTGDDNAPF